MSAGVVVAIIGVSLTLGGIVARIIYKQGRSDRDSESVADFKLEVIRRLQSLSDADVNLALIQERSMGQYNALVQAVTMLTDRVEGLEDRERGRGPR